MVQNIMQWDSGCTVLSATQMAAADNCAIASGISADILMEQAGKAVFSAIIENIMPNNTIILCGSGNNGGDGFVIARLLTEAGWPITVASMVPIEEYTGSAKIMAQKYQQTGGKILSFTEAMEKIANYKVVIDAIFGTGLNRNITGIIADLITAVNKGQHYVLSVDIPTGINGNTGQIQAAAIRANHTVTFACKKLGHLLLPGFLHTGKLTVADIGITKEHIAQQNPKYYENNPKLWQHMLPAQSLYDHKYKRGHAAIIAGNIEYSGAGLLASEAAIRSGVGITTIFAPKEALAVYAIAAKKAAIKRCMTTLKQFITSDKITSWLFGPGAGISAQTAQLALTLLKQQKNTILDADALTSFADNNEELHSNLHPKSVITPHFGEFTRIFPKTTSGNKVQLAQNAAKTCNSNVIIKGADTVLATADGKVIINTATTPQLATAGSGDVLAGLITGFAAQNIPIPAAAAIAIFVHSRSAMRAGEQIIADDLLSSITEVIIDLKNINC